MSSPIVLLTDFGTQDGYVGAMKGQIARIAPHAQVIDLSHDLPPQSIPAARFVLWRHYRYFPLGTIFVCVVDPGVGTERDILYVNMDGYSFLAPDNGLLDYVLADFPTNEAYIVQNRDWMSLELSHTFHGRDIFAPVAAHLANREPVKQIGPVKWLPPPASPFLTADTPGRVQARVIYVDTYGNVITNLRLQPDQRGRILLPREVVPQFLTYGAVSPGTPLCLLASHGLLEIAIRNGNAAAQFSLQPGDEIIWEPELGGKPSHDQDDDSLLEES